MYKTLIDLNQNVSNEVLGRLSSIVVNAFNNRAGSLINVSSNPYRFVFEGEEDDYGCLQLGNLALDKNQEFRKYVINWNWEDEEPEESCDLIVEFSKPVY
jgi:hypothetical protein